MTTAAETWPGAMPAITLAACVPVRILTDNMSRAVVVEPVMEQDGIEGAIVCHFEDHICRQAGDVGAVPLVDLVVDLDDDLGFLYALRAAFSNARNRAALLAAMVKAHDMVRDRGAAWGRIEALAIGATVPRAADRIAIATALREVTGG